MTPSARLMRSLTRFFQNRFVASLPYQSVAPSIISRAVAEDGMEHGLGEPTGKGILLAGMVGTNKGNVVQVVTLAMSEFRSGRRNLQADFPPSFEIG